MLTITQIAQRYATLYTCGCAYNLPTIIILLSGTGIVVGALTYYFLSKNIEERRKKFNKNKKQLLKFLEQEEQQIIEILIQNKGETTQTNITQKLNLNRVKVFRTIEKLENKKMITKEKKGKINNIKLTKELQEILL